MKRPWETALRREIEAASEEAQSPETVRTALRMTRASGTRRVIGEAHATAADSSEAGARMRSWTSRRFTGTLVGASIPSRT